MPLLQSRFNCGLCLGGSCDSFAGATLCYCVSHGEGYTKSKFDAYADVPTGGAVTHELSDLQFFGFRGWRNTGTHALVASRHHPMFAGPSDQPPNTKKGLQCGG